MHKDDVIAYALQKYKGIDHKKAVMIGDRSHDIMGGKRMAWIRSECFMDLETGKN